MLAIIPARGGSKRLPNKNVRLLGGIPLIGHTIRAAKRARSVSRVVVSTDDEAIARVAAEEGAEVLSRPAELAGDDSMVMDAYLHAVDHLASRGEIDDFAFVALLPTAPLRLPADIDGSVEIFQSQAADGVISVTEAPVPVQWYRRVDDQGILRSFLPKGDALSNRQVHENAYVPNGAVYVFRTAVLRSTRQYYTDRTWPFVMPRERSVDIDDILDFEWAEFLLARVTGP